MGFRDRGIEIKTPEQIDLMRVAGRLVGETLELLREATGPGVTTLELDTQITRDGHAVVSHDNTVDGQKCRDTGPVKPGDPSYPYVGKRVTIVGEQREGSTEVEVKTVDGKAVREPGKPPWAGGWKVVGKDHPGWSQEKADRHAAKAAEKKARFGLDCWPPGHCKDAAGKPKTPKADPTPAP